MAQAAPYREAHPRQARRGGGLPGFLRDGQELRQGRKGADRSGTRGARGPGVPGPRLAPRRVPGRLRPGGLPRPRDAPAGPLPGGRVPALQRRARPGVLGRDGRVRVPRAARRVRVRRRRAFAGGVRQRHRGRPQGRLQGRDVGALPGVRRPLRPRLQLHQPLLGQREGQRGEQGGGAQAQPVRPGPLLPRRRGVQPQASGALRGRLGGEAALQEGGRGVRALRGGPRRDVPAARRALLLRGVGDEEVRRPGLLQGGRRPPLLRRAGARRRRGRGRDGRVRGDGGGPRRGGRRDLREDVGRRADLLHGPAGAA